MLEQNLGAVICNRGTSTHLNKKGSAAFCLTSLKCINHSNKWRILTLQQQIGSVDKITHKLLPDWHLFSPGGSTETWRMRTSSEANTAEFS